MVLRSKDSGLSLQSPDNKQEPLDFDRILEEFDGDKEFLKDLLDGFVKNVKEQIVALKKALSEGNAHIVIKEAHSIKGGAANLTAYGLSGCASELERLAGGGSLMGGMEVIKRLELEFQKIETCANRF